MNTFLARIFSDLRFALRTPR